MEKCLKKKLRRALTRAEVEAIINDWSDDETEIAGICIVPPTVDDVTDEEDLDDDIIPMQDVGILCVKS